MSNHLHVVVQILPEVVSRWSNAEIVERWMCLSAWRDQNPAVRAEVLARNHVQRARSRRPDRVARSADRRRIPARSAPVQYLGAEPENAMKPLLLAVVLAAAMLVSTTAQPHAVLESSLPASGSVLDASPAEISLSFHEPTLLNVLAVVSPSGERRLDFRPVGVATEFTAATPELAVGRNEVQWRALSKDGHVVSGSIIIVVKPPTP
jgi:methionine-rich copper-binding protein CopC